MLPLANGLLRVLVYVYSSSGLQAKGYTYNKTAPYVTGGVIGDGYYKQKFDYMNLHGDVMFNLNALFGGYNSQRVYGNHSLFGCRFCS